MSLFDRVGEQPLSEADGKLADPKKLPILTNNAVTKLIPMFVEGSPSASDHKCGSCKFILSGSKCALVATTVSKTNGSCAYWSGGTPAKPAEAHARQMRPSEAQYLEVRAGTKINCASCKFFRKSVVETMGSRAERNTTTGIGVCALWHGRVHDYDCCMAWSSSAAKTSG